MRGTGSGRTAIVSVMICLLAVALPTAAGSPLEPTPAVAVRSVVPARASDAGGRGPVYLALGDSLAASVQVNGTTRSGYAEQVFQLEQAAVPDLRLVKLGCPGERTNTMGRPRRPCPYPQGSQLDQALSVLRRGNVAFVTLQIGSNDTFRCFDFRHTAFDRACIEDLLPKISARLTSIVRGLQAADPDVPIVGLNYPDPLLALTIVPGFPPERITAINDVWTAMNDTLGRAYAALGVPVADVAAEFSTADFDTIVRVRGFGDLPINSARICQWTAMCTTNGGDPHPNTIGYAAMTRAVEAALDLV